MGYVLDLRRQVGHQPLVVAGAALMAQNSIGKIVLIYRTDNHCWGLPAGSTSANGATGIERRDWADGG